MLVPMDEVPPIVLEDLCKGFWSLADRVGAFR